MFDKEAMEEMLLTVKNMSDAERQSRAQSLSKLLEAEMKRRGLLPEAGLTTKDKWLQWLRRFWKDD